MHPRSWAPKSLFPRCRRCGAQVAHRSDLCHHCARYGRAAELRNRRAHRRGAVRFTSESAEAFRHTLKGDPCSYCGSYAPCMTIDHIVPRSAGGLTTPDNSTAACERCNREKGSQSLLGFLARKWRAA